MDRPAYERTKEWLEPLGLGAPLLHERTLALYKTQPKKLLLNYGTRLDPSVIEVADVESQCLDGFIVKIFTGTWDAPGQQSNGAFCATRYTYESWAAPLAAWQSLTFENVKNNFFVIQTAAAPQADWYSDSDMAILVANMRDLARVAKEAGFVGLCFDLEAYSGSHPFQYDAQAQYPTKTLAEYKAKVRYWAHVMMDEMISVFPDFKFFTFQNYYAEISTAYLGDANPYGLLGAFYDGVLDSARKNRWSLPHRVCLSTELSFSCTDAGCLSNASSTNQNAPYQGDSLGFEAYKSHGLALWMDYGGTFSYSDFSSNYFSPTLFQSMVSSMLNPYTSYSGISWIYCQQPQFFDQVAGREVPQAYLDAIRAARDAAGLKVW